VVTICTTSLTFTNSVFCPHSVFVCFVWISEQTAIISLCNINWLVFITETECVYCTVRTECSIAVQINIASSKVFASAWVRWQSLWLRPDVSRRRCTDVLYCETQFPLGIPINTLRQLVSFLLHLLPRKYQYNDCSLIFLCSSRRISEYSCRRSVALFAPAHLHKRFFSPAAVPIICTGFPVSGHRLIVPIVHCV
jgi:hypothetical protein